MTTAYLRSKRSRALWVRRGIGVPLIIFSLIVVAPAAGFAATSSSKIAKDGVAHVPAVGCPSEGQVGTMESPQVHSLALRISRAIAQRLAYYKAEYGPGVLAPRGWHCFAIYGSNGESLFVSQQPIRSSDLFSSGWKGFVGPAIQISESIGDTSGRFEVAKVIARVFPSRAAFVQEVIAEKIEPASSFPFGPYPGDRLIRRNNDLVEFETQADAEGLGTHSRLQKGDTPISGVVVLFGPEPNLLQLSMRLSSDSADLGQSIVRQAERVAAKAGH
jgi:hypothetical protein